MQVLKRTQNLGLQSILKSSKWKKKLCKRYSKNGTSENEATYKDITNLFETIKHKSK